MNNPKVSIITICYQAEKTIADTIQSVLAQTYSNIEYIIIDGASKDKTLAIIETFNHPRMQVFSEKDKGLYDALNKGIAKATGDYIGFLHADDIYAHTEVICEFFNLFSVYGTQAISSSVSIFKNNQFDKVFRNYDATKFRKWQFNIGIQPPHPGFFITKESLISVGNFDTNYKISGDFDWLLRAIKKNQITVHYSKFVSVFMRDGGISSSGLKSKILMNNEDLQSLRKNGYKSHILLIWMKYFIKSLQLLK